MTERSPDDWICHARRRIGHGEEKEMETKAPGPMETDTAFADAVRELSEGGAGLER